KERRVYARLAQQAIDGICAVRYLADDSGIRLAAEAKLPVVVIGSRPRDLAVDSVGVFGTARALQALLTPLVAAGVRRLAFVTGTEDAIVGQVRSRIYRQIVTRLHLVDDPA